MSGASPALARAAASIAEAEGLLITAGAGLGVDSGLPDFRGPEGFWAAYPAYRHLGLGFSDLANPRWFRADPALAWGFYGHRLALYRATVPHAGFAVLRRLAARAPAGAFVFTSNVDGQFQRAGFDEARLVECHGSIHHVQCLASCGLGIAAYEGPAPEVDPATFRAAAPLPSCPRCGGLLRPNVLMFGDGAWEPGRTEAQEARLERWLAAHRGRLVVIELGAGTAVPTVRRVGDQLALRGRATLVRINVREPEVPPGQVGLALGARDALEAIASALPQVEASGA